MPTKPIYSLFLCLVFLLPGTVAVAKAETAAAAEKPEYLTPDKMTREDRAMLAEHADNYNACLTQTSIEQMNQQADPRHVVDFAMKKCAIELENLDKKMIERNFDPNFRQGYLHRISNRGANNVLQAVMMAMANRSAAEATAPAE